MKMTRKKILRKYCRFRFVYELRLADSSDFNLQLISDFIQQECLYPAYSMCKNSIMPRKISLLAPTRLFANWAKKLPFAPVCYVSGLSSYFLLTAFKRQVNRDL